MTQHDTTQMLSRYTAGDMNAAEREELNSLCGRDDVFAAADRRVAAIHRRRTVMLTLATLAIVGTAALLLRPSHGEVLVAEQRQPAPAPTSLAAPVPTPVSSVDSALSAEPASPRPASTRAAKPRPRAAEQEPVVVCNNQCEADSVINDIWKFLSA